MNNNYLESAIKQFEYYKWLGDSAIEQVRDDHLYWQFNSTSNSIATIVQHLVGNMHSRWTDFLTTDGEKPERNRDAEFEPSITTREELIKRWNEGWDVLLTTLKKLSTDDLTKIIYIRNQGHTVTEAINRQLAHYPYHVGQLVFIGKMCATNWQSLSIPKGDSQVYNKHKFNEAKHRQHFTDEFRKPQKP